MNFEEAYDKLTLLAMFFVIALALIFYIDNQIRDNNTHEDNSHRYEVVNKVHPHALANAINGRYD